MNLKPFTGENTRCNKCGHCYASTEYKRVEYFFSPPVEYLQRKCSSCGYMWKEYCMDDVSQYNMPWLMEERESK